MRRRQVFADNQIVPGRRRRERPAGPEPEDLRRARGVHSRGRGPEEGDGDQRAGAHPRAAEGSDGEARRSRRRGRGAQG